MKKNILKKVFAVASSMVLALGITASAANTSLFEYNFNDWGTAWYSVNTSPDSSDWYTLKGENYKMEFNDGTGVLINGTPRFEDALKNQMKYRLYLKDVYLSGTRAAAIGYNKYFDTTSELSNNNTPYIKYRPYTKDTNIRDANSLGTDKLITQCLIRCDNPGGARFALSLVQNDGTTKFNRAVWFKAGGTIEVGGVAGVSRGTWKNGTVYRVSIVIDIGTNRGDVYINGDLIANNVALGEGGKQIVGINYVYMYADFTTPTTDPTKMAYFDELSVYDGDMPKVVSNENTCLISEEDNTIIATNYNSVGTLLSAMTLPADATVTYKDSEKAEKAEDAAVETGDVLTLADGVFTRKYAIVNNTVPYTIGDISYTCAGNLVNENMFTTGELSASVDVNIFQADASVNAALISAKYSKDGRLESVKMDSDNISASKTLTITDEITDTDGKIKLFVWDSATLMTPIKSLVLRNDRTNVYLASDSLVCDYADNYYPQAGWGTFLKDNMTDDVKVINKAVGGSTAKSFYNTYWTAIKNDLKDGDYVILSFMHNDDHTLNVNETFDEYKEYLKKFIDETREKGAEIVLFTGFNRGEVTDTHIVTLDGVVYDFPQAMKDVAQANSVTLLDLHQKIMDYIAANDITAVKKQFFLYYVISSGYITEEQLAVHPNTTLRNYREDLTHLNIDGAKTVASWIAELLKASDSPLSEFAK